jgi:hypothetical protein
VTNDLDTLLTALYVEIDDHVIPSGQRRPGGPKRLSDAELVCLAVAQVLLGARSEHHWLRLCYGRLGHLFPYLPKQPGYHKRLKAAAPLLAAVLDHLARQSPSWYDPVRLIDATPVPCGASRETVKRSELVLGLKLYRITAPDRMPAAWCLADPKLGEREVAEDLLAPCGPRRGAPPRVDRLDPAVDRVGQRHSQGPPRSGTPRRPHHRGHLHPYLQRLLAMAACIWHNWATGEPAKRSLTAYDN